MDKNLKSQYILAGLKALRGYHKVNLANFQQMINNDDSYQNRTYSTQKSEEHIKNINKIINELA